MDELPLERRLEFQQLSDPRLKELSKELEFKDNDKFELIDGLIYRKIDNKRKFVIPKSMVVNIIRVHHDDMAHNGPEKTLRGIQKNFWFTSMRKRVYSYIDNCLICLMASSASNVREGETHLSPPPKKPVRDTTCRSLWFSLRDLRQIQKYISFSRCVYALYLVVRG